MDLRNLSSNWKTLQASGKLNQADRSRSSTQKPTTPISKRAKLNDSLKRKRAPHSELLAQFKEPSARKKPRRIMTSEQASSHAQQHNSTGEAAAAAAAAAPTAPNTMGERINEGLAEGVDVGKYIAIDCEMVGVGPTPHLESALARVSIVNYNGEQVYDSYVKPQEEVTDWRTHVSGIQPKHMVYARSFEEVQSDIALLLKDRIVVGHSVRGDFEALFLDHPKRDVRDTARYPPYRKLVGGVSPKLKVLASELLGLDIQAGEHSSVEDARAAMLLFRRDKDGFEREHTRKWGPPVNARKSEEQAANGEAKKSTKKKKRKRLHPRAISEEECNV